MELDDLLHELVIAIDATSKQYEESTAKKSNQYKNSKKYKINDTRYLRELLIKRNTIVEIINYIRSGDEKVLDEIDYR